jgi:hypothetical protein
MIFQRGSEMSESDQDEDYELDELLSVKTGIQADEYVRKAFKHAGLPARDALFERFTARIRDAVAERPATTPATVAVQAGGGLTKVQSDKFYDFFQYVDSLHDFAQYVDPDYIAQSLGAELPEILRDGTWHRMRVEDLHGPGSTFFKDITSSPKIRFAGAPEFDNPLFGRDFEQGMLRYDGYPDVQTSADKASPPCEGCSNVEIWSYPDASMKILKLEQIVDAVCRIHGTFGRDTKFVVDESIPLTRLLLSMDLVYKSFLSSYRIDMTSKEDTMDMVDAWKAWMEMTTSWKAVTCDSGLMDAEAHDFPLHDAPTGRVFRDGSLVQVEMMSSSVTKVGKKVNKTYEYKLSSDTLSVWRDSKEHVIKVTNDKVGPNRSPNCKDCKDGTPPSWCIFAQKPRTRPQSEIHRVVATRHSLDSLRRSPPPEGLQVRASLDPPHHCCALGFSNATKAQTGGPHLALHRSHRGWTEVAPPGRPQSTTTAAGKKNPIWTHQNRVLKLS